MTQSEHQWSITNLRSGWLVTEGCLHCGAKASFFSFEERPPIDAFFEGEHHWRYLESAQAVRFDLSCAATGTTAELDNVLGLLLCMRCDPDCLIGCMSRLLGSDNTSVYLALCADPSHRSGACARPEEARALTEYFNGRIKAPGKKIVFLPCSLRRNSDSCRGEVVADVGMTALY